MINKKIISQLKEMQIRAGMYAFDNRHNKKIFDEYTQLEKDYKDLITKLNEPTTKTDTSKANLTISDATPPYLEEFKDCCNIHYVCPVCKHKPILATKGVDNSKDIKHCNKCGNNYIIP